MKTWLPGCLIVFFLSTVNGWAAQPLNDAQMDQVIAGDLPSCSAGAVCESNLSSSATMTNTTTNINGVTSTTTTNAFSCTAATCTNQVSSGGTTIPTTCTSNCSSQVSDKVANGASNTFGMLTTGNPPNLPTFPLPPQLPIPLMLPPFTVPSGV
jgi:hypothetical protein